MSRRILQLIFNEELWRCSRPSEIKMLGFMTMHRADHLPAAACISGGSRHALLPGPGKNVGPVKRKY
jgi:hypothetical protein